MGCRFSASITPEAIASSTSSAKVITISGALREYSAAPIPASIVLADCKPPTPAAEEESSSSSYFLCNADALLFDAPIPALAPEDPVERGQLYFVLPDCMQRRPLSGADLGALAVRASKAIEAAAGRVGRSGMKKGRALKLSPVVHVGTAKKGSSGDGCSADRHRATVGSTATRLPPAQLKKSAGVVVGQRRGQGMRGSRHARRGGSMRGRLGTIEEDGE